MLKKLKTWIFRNKIKAIIFDYDGVLNDSLEALRLLYNEFYRFGFIHTYFKDDVQFSKFFQGDCHKNMEAAGMELTEENIKKADEFVKKVLPPLDDKASFYEGVAKLIHRLKDDGYRLAIVSNGYEPVISAKLKRYGLENTIDHIIDYYQVSKPKPSPEGLLKCLKALNLKPKETLYIGDMESDVQAAKAAGIKVIATTYGYYHLRDDKFERLQDADMFADSVDEVYEKIKNA